MQLDYEPLGYDFVIWLLTKFGNGAVYIGEVGEKVFFSAGKD
jgi:hypothetical protein